MVRIMEDRIVNCGDLFRHFKGMLYQVIGVATHSETQEPMVVYQALYGDYSLYVRPLEMFLSVVDKELYPEVDSKYRFTKIDRASLDHFAHTTSKKKEKEVLLRKDAETITQDSSEDQPALDVQFIEAGVITDNLVNTDLMDFLDAKDYGEKLEVLYSIRKRIDERVMSDIEMSLDLPVLTGTIEDRIALVRTNLQTMAKFEGQRLR